ncbi:hypothetical protein MNEG_13217 [Monoraphidium neglectum]|uniref:Uncharacterized protein n=1 Tax=Monoraphidium neglectum TaxID=145388 RepID=A0A0D2LT01_9CHLO|nr:hypothetical protein MNEG_13217 [Monoraphidium neglectum]KIY94744.1 hypothetical protein MNEG_13217 [Monoraphidium neglectum]|eukprot:XP_013893764.1 hypothetical protein MNEG_13217 [Monoraphidium neglectum]
MGELLPYVKDKQADALREKLVMRLEHAPGGPKEWRWLAFCLVQLGYSEKATRRFMDLTRAYKHTLAEDEVFEVFVSLADKARKAPPSASARAGGAGGDLKEKAEEWARQLQASVWSSAAQAPQSALALRHPFVAAAPRGEAREAALEARSVEAAAAAAQRGRRRSAAAAAAGENGGGAAGHGGEDAEEEGSEGGGAAEANTDGSGDLAAHGRGRAGPGPAEAAAAAEGGEGGAAAAPGADGEDGAEGEIVLMRSQPAFEEPDDEHGGMVDGGAAEGLREQLEKLAVGPSGHARARGGKAAARGRGGGSGAVGRRAAAGAAGRRGTASRGDGDATPSSSGEEQSSGGSSSEASSDGSDSDSGAAAAAAAAAAAKAAAARRPAARARNGRRAVVLSDSSEED